MHVLFPLGVSGPVTPGLELETGPNIDSPKEEEEPVTDGVCIKSLHICARVKRHNLEKI